MERKKQNSKEEERARVLNYFIDPQNPHMGYEKFARETLEMFTNGDNSQESKEMQEQLMGMFTQIKDARKFNETYIGHMLSEASIPGMWGYMMALRLGSNTVAREVSEMESRLEPEAIHGLMEIVGYNPNEASGTFTSGGSMAVFTALDVAVKRIKREFDISKKTLDKPLVVLYNKYSHYSFHKAIDALGGPNRMIEKVEVSSPNFRMDTKDLESKINQYLREGRIIAAIYGIAGETETGLVDNLLEISKIAMRHNIFTIADGAYGAPYRLSRKGELFRGIESFGAIIIDGHKALYTPYSNGAILFKDKKDHVLLNLGVKAPYVKFEENEEALLRNLAYKNPKFSLGEKRFEGSGGAGSIISTVAVLRTFGLDGLATVYDMTLDRIDYLHERLNQSQVLMPIHKPDVNLQCFRIRPEIERKYGILDNSRRSEIVEKSRIDDVDKGLTGSGGFFFSSTDFDLPDYNGTVLPTSVWRACLMNPRTTNEILDKAVAELEKSVLQRLQSK